MSEASTAPRWKILLPLLLGTLALVAWLEVAGWSLDPSAGDYGVLPLGHA